VTITVTLNSSSVTIDSSLSNLVINSTNFIGYVFVRHFSSDSTLRNFTVNFALSGTYLIYIGSYSSSFLAIPSVIIQMTAPLIGSPQGTQPILQFVFIDFIKLTSSSINMTLQCSQPSTIYWVSGMYPTAIGIF